MCILCFVASIRKASPYKFGWSKVKFCSSLFNTTKHYIIVSIILATNCTQIPLIRVDPILFSVQLNVSINMRKVRNKLWLDFLIWYNMMTSSNGNIFRVTDHLCGEFTSHRLIPHTKASDAKLWFFLWSAPWINGWVNNGEAGDLGRHRTHYDVIVVSFILSKGIIQYNISTHW